MNSRRGAKALVALVLTLASACGGDADPAADIKLDGSAREPDLAGIVTDVSLQSIEIDGDAHALSKKLLAFSTYTLTAIPVLSTDGAYVHAGLKGGKVTWVALVAKRMGGSDGTGRGEAFYDGTIRRVDGRVIQFQDGTVLEAAKDVTVPAKGSRVIAQLDPEHDVIVGFGGG